jgi:hypothetical protein
MVRKTAVVSIAKPDEGSLELTENSFTPRLAHTRRNLSAAHGCTETSGNTLRCKGSLVCSITEGAIPKRSIGLERVPLPTCSPGN